MPRENKKRGRRAETQKRQADALDTSEQVHDSKKRRVSVDEPVPGEPAPADSYEPSQQPEVEFYGLLDDDEQEYFRRADDMLEVNNFQDAEERTLFLENLHKEAVGKELKLACSQSCSRLLERLILLSTPTQLRALFQKLNGHFLNLVQHRFASHVCETLFTQSAPIVTTELLEAPQPTSDDDDGVFVTMENLFLYAINELEGKLAHLLTERFASHTLRVLLVVLSGLPLESTRRSLLKSKAKENIDVPGREEQVQSKRQVPSSFTEALQRLIAGSVATLDTTSLRSLALHPIGNPTLQLLVRLELTQFGKQKAKDDDSVLHKLLPDESLSEDSESGGFINGLVYDTVGSRLLETIIEYAPGKTFKSIYRQFFKERIASLARNEIAGYVACKILERLGSEDLRVVIDSIIPLIPNLAERGRTSVIKTLVERCTVRGVNSQGLVDAVSEAYADDSGAFSLPKLLQLQPEAPGGALGEQKSSQSWQHNAVQTHASVLAQAFLASPGPPAELIYTGLAGLPTETCLALARSPTFSHIFQQALTNPTATIIHRRKVISRFQSHVASLATHPSGSHLVDAIWKGTQGLAFMRERVAEELAEAEASLRDSPTGRKVWRNWKMDLYQRRRGDWVREQRDEAGNEGFVSFPDGDNSVASVEPAAARGATASTVNSTTGHKMRRVDRDAAKKGKTALQLAREKFAKNKASGVERGAGSGANGVAVKGGAVKGRQTNSTAMV